MREGDPDWGVKYQRTKTVGKNSGQKQKKEWGTNTGAKLESKNGQIFMGRNDAKYFGQKLSSMFENKSLF